MGRVTEELVGAASTQPSSLSPAPTPVVPEGFTAPEGLVGHRLKATNFHIYMENYQTLWSNNVTLKRQNFRKINLTR